MLIASLGFVYLTLQMILTDYFSLTLKGVRMTFFETDASGTYA